MGEKHLEELVRVPYRIKLYPLGEENDQIEWVAEIPDLPGCIGCGDTPEEALLMVEDAKRSWLESALADGISVPEPKNPDDSSYSGKFTLRVPRSLHKELSLKAEDEGLSLNQYIVYLITKSHHESCVSNLDGQIIYTEVVERTFKGPSVKQTIWPDDKVSKRLHYLLEGVGDDRGKIN